MIRKKFLQLLVASLLVVAGFSVSAQNNPAYIKNNDGVTIYPDANFSGNAQAVKLEVIADNIVHVVAAPLKDIPVRNSLSVVPYKTNATWKLNEQNGKLVLTTAKLSVSADLKTGAISFADSTGKNIVAERNNNGRKIESAFFEGEPLYAVAQTFETSPDDSYYGLGQHQDDVYNYKDQQVTLFQNNTEVAVPFLVSSKNYGILWDNYSLSSVGDTRPWKALSALKLFSPKGDEGWLTASYSNDRNQPENVAFEKAESVINYEYLNATKLYLPKEFAIDKGMVTYSGSIQSGETGTHKFKFTYAGYIKVWVEGKLMLDRWRQAWNPGTGVFKVDMEAGKKYQVKIQWIPDGSESYLTAKWLPPVPEKDKNTFTFNSEAGRAVDYYFVYGKTMDDVIGGYRTLTGKASLMPRWSLGFWQSRERYKTQDEILSTVDEYRKRKIPLDNIVLDWSYWKQDAWGSQEFDPIRFPSPDSMISVLHKKYHTQIMISVWPKFYEGIPAYNFFNSKGWLYKRNIADRQRDWIAQGYISTFYDAFNGDARKGFWQLIHDKIYTKGIDAWWMDASEPDILSNVSPEKRKEQMTPTALGTAAEYLNAYPLENARGIYEGQRSVDSNKRVFLLTRSGFAGSQRYAAAIWSGDIATHWSDLKAQISAGLNFSMSGIPYWTMDIGGFSVEHRYEKPTEKDLDEWRELNARWYQFGAFCPLFRSHGQFPYREIYNISPEGHPAYKSMLFYNKLRYRLLPYIYSIAGATTQHDYTMMRGLVMDFASDTAVKNISDQYMFGPSLLINPIYTYKATTRQMYLPSGQGWFNFYSGEFNEGGKHITADAPYERMPLFVKEGSIIPIGPELQYSNEKPATEITLFVYTGKDAAFTLYEDENVNYNYEKGAFTNIHFNYNESTHSLTIGDREGSFEGMLKSRSFNINWIDRQKPVPFDPERKADTVVKYNGKQVVIKR